MTGSDPNRTPAHRTWLMIALVLILGGIFFLAVHTRDERPAPPPSTPPATPTPSPTVTAAQNGDELFIRGEFAAARAAYLEEIKRSPASPVLNRHLGYVNELLKDRANAEKYYARAIELDPQNFELFRDYFEYCLPFRHFKDAEARFRRMEKLFSGRGVIISDNDIKILGQLAQGQRQEEGRFYLHMAYSNLARVAQRSTERLSRVEEKFFRERALGYVKCAQRAEMETKMLLSPGQAIYYTGLVEALEGNDRSAIGKISQGLSAGLADPSNEMNARTILFLLAMRQGDYKPAQTYMDDCRRMLQEWKGPETNRFAPLMETIYFLSTVHGLGDV